MTKRGPRLPPRRPRGCRSPGSGLRPDRRLRRYSLKDIPEGYPLLRRGTLGAAAPVLDAVMVGSEPVVHTPQYGLSATAHTELAIDRPNVGLHGVWAQVRQPRDVCVAHALGDQRQNLRLAFAEPFTAAGPVLPRRAACSRSYLADDHFTGMHGLQGRDQLARGQGLRQIPLGPVPSRALNEFGVKVPGVDHNSACPGIGHQDTDLFVIGFGLGE